VRLRNPSEVVIVPQLFSLHQGTTSSQANSARISRRISFSESPALASRGLPSPYVEARSQLSIFAGEKPDACGGRCLLQIGIKRRKR
jgi:hypothetical protein